MYDVRVVIIHYESCNNNYIRNVTFLQSVVEFTVKRLRDPI